MIQNTLHMSKKGREGVGGFTTYWPLAIAQLDNRSVPSETYGGAKI